MSRFLSVVVALPIVAALAGCPGSGSSTNGTGSGGTPDTGPPSLAKVGDLSAVIRTTRGDVTIDLLERLTPRTVANFCNLAQRGVYDGVAFHRWTRVVRQAGALPLSYAVPQESHHHHLFDAGGRVAAVQRTEGDRAFSHPCQFFITVKNQERWDLDYTVFANVTAGQPVVDSIQRDDATSIDTIEIIGDPTPLYDLLADDLAQWNAAIDKANLAKR